ncbi:IS200/IS605 family transposase [Micromonospora sagamiensis]|nr:IS200/IS605 family transposase [Micromonospora sagamiensis]
MDEVRSNNNVVYRCHYHVVWCPKYRRKVIGGEVPGQADQGSILPSAAPGAPAPQVPDADPWTNSYFVATTGGATVEVIKRYVENQRNV